MGAWCEQPGREMALTVAWLLAHSVTVWCRVAWRTAELRRRSYLQGKAPGAAEGARAEYGVVGRQAAESVWSRCGGGSEETGGGQECRRGDGHEKADG